MKTRDTMRFTVFEAGLLLLAFALAACNPLVDLRPPAGTTDNPPGSGGATPHKGGGAMKLTLLMPNYDHIKSRAIHPGTTQVRVLTRLNPGDELEEFGIYTLPAPDFDAPFAAGNPVSTTVSGFSSDAPYDTIKVELLDPNNVVLTESFAYSVTFSSSETTQVYFFCTPSDAGFQESRYHDLILNQQYNDGVARADMVYYRTWLPSGNYVATITPNGGTYDNPDMYLFDPQGQYAGGYLLGVSYVYTDSQPQSLSFSVVSDGYYYVGVYGYNSWEPGTTAFYSLTLSAVVNDPPSVPDNPTPAIAATVSPSTNILDWSDSTDPEGDSVTYDVYWWDGSGYNLVRSGLTASYFDPVSAGITLGPNHLYYWYVVSRDQHGGSGSGSEWYFWTDIGSSVANFDFNMGSNDWPGQYSTPADVTAHLNVPTDGDYIPNWSFSLQVSGDLTEGPFEFGIGSDAGDNYAILKDTAGSSSYNYTMIRQRNLSHIVQAGENIHIRFRIMSYSGGDAVYPGYDSPVEIVVSVGGTPLLLKAFTLAGYATDGGSEGGLSTGTWYDRVIPIADRYSIMTPDFPYEYLSSGFTLDGVGVISRGHQYEVDIDTFEIVQGQNIPPIAYISADISTITAGGWVTFGALGNFGGPSSYDPDAGDSLISYFYNFGDGNTTYVGSAPMSHQYPSEGTYSAFLQVEDSQGIWSPPRYMTITVQQSGTGGYNYGVE